MCTLKVWNPVLGHGMVSHEVGATAMIDGPPVVFVHFACGCGSAIPPEDLWPRPPGRADVALHMVEGGTA